MALPLPENNNNDNLLSYEDEDDEGSMSSGQGSNNSIGSKKSRPQRTKRQHFKKKGKKQGILNFHKTDIKGNQLHNPGIQPTLLDHDHSVADCERQGGQLKGLDVERGLHGNGRVQGGGGWGGGQPGALRR